MLRAELIMVGGEDRSLIPAIYLHYLSLSLSLFIYTRARAHTHTHTHTHTHRSLLPAHLRRQQLADKESLDNGDADDESWWEKVQDLELNNRHLRKLSNLERLVNLKVLSVCDNEILAIQGLERWVACVRSRRVCLGMCVCVCVCVCVVRIIRCHRCAARTWASICLVCAHPRTGRARAHTHTHATPRVCVSHTYTHNTAHGCVQFNACMRTLKHMHTHSCVLLEELLMEENRVSKIENLSALVYLKKLDLGKNKIQRIEGLEALSSLVQVVFVCVCLCMCVRSRAREIVQVVCVCVCARARERERDGEI